MDLTLLPDYSDTLDGPAWDEYHRIPEGGTVLADIRAAGRALATVEFTTTQNTDATGGAHLGLEFNVPRCCIPMPIGLRQSDLFFQQLERIAKRPAPERYLAQRGRLVDSYVDGHKYLFEKRAVVYGEEDLVVGLVSMLAEIGVTPVLCASGGKSGKLRESVEAVAPDLAGSMTIVQDVDFMDIERQATDLAPDVVIGNSNGFKLAKELDCPLLRVGLPIHDRIGAARVRHLGYEGAQEIFDRLVNLMIEAKQNASPVGYTHM